MRLALICVALAGCATAPTAPVDAQKPVARQTRNCPALPTVPPGANRTTLLNIIAAQAEMYAGCAEMR